MHMNEWHRRVCTQTEASICTCVKWNRGGCWMFAISNLFYVVLHATLIQNVCKDDIFSLFLCTWYVFWQKETNWFYYNSGLKKFPQECMSIYTGEPIMKQRRCYGFTQHGHITWTNSFHNVRDASYKRTNVIYMSTYTQTTTGIHTALKKKGKLSNTLGGIPT